jgi:hypothetical protein
MKKLLLTFAVLTSFVFSACKKDEIEEPPTPEVKCTPTKLAVAGNAAYNENTDEFSINLNADKRPTSLVNKDGSKQEIVYTDNRITRINFIGSTGTLNGYDAITYNAQGQVDKISVRNPSGTEIVTYDVVYGTNNGNATITTLGETFEFNSSGYLIKSRDFTYTYDSAPAKFFYAEWGFSFPILIRLAVVNNLARMEGYAMSAGVLPATATYSKNTTTYTVNYTNITKNQANFATAFKQTYTFGTTNYTKDYTLSYNCQ